MPPPLVSVVMPCFNAGRMLRPTLQSVLAQTYPNLEIVFVDNNSTDGSADLARQLLGTAGRPFTLTACSAQGVNHARDLACRSVNGDYVQWMDADDLLDPDKIGHQVAALETDASRDIAYADWTGCHMRRGEPDVVRRFALRQDDDQLLRVLSGTWYPPHVYLLRRAAADRLQHLGAWTPERIVATDVEYIAIAAVLGMRFRHVPGAHVQYNVWSDGQISNSTPLATRTAHLRAIFLRLREMVETGGAGVPLSQRHKVLLYQGWEMWRLRRDGLALVRLNGRRFSLRDQQRGRQIELRPREATAVRWLLKAGTPGTSYHYATIMAATVPELADCQVAIVQLLERLKREEFVQFVDGDGDAAQPRPPTSVGR